MGTVRIIFPGGSALLSGYMSLSITTAMPKGDALFFRGVSTFCAVAVRGNEDNIVERSWSGWWVLLILHGLWSFFRSTILSLESGFRSTWNASGHWHRQSRH